MQLFKNIKWPKLLRDDSPKFKRFEDYVSSREYIQFWVPLFEVETDIKFKRQLIDDSLSGTRHLIKWMGADFEVVDGLYGHCMNYPEGFKVKIATPVSKE